MNEIAGENREKRKNKWRKKIVNGLSIKEWTIKRMEHELNRWDILEHPEKEVNLKLKLELVKSKYFGVIPGSLFSDFSKGNFSQEEMQKYAMGGIIIEETVKAIEKLTEKCLEFERDGFHVIRASLKGFRIAKLEGYKFRNEEEKNNNEKILKNKGEWIFFSEDNLLITQEIKTKNNWKKMSFEEIDKVIEKNGKDFLFDESCFKKWLFN